MSFFRKPERITESAAEVESDLSTLRGSASDGKVPPHISSLAFKEIEKLEKMDAGLPEYTIGVGYLEFMLSLPWLVRTEDNLDMERARQALEMQHYGLTRVKERILEYLAVKTLRSRSEFHVLVVDDEEIARTNLEYVLRKEGYSVRTAENGLEAFEMVKRHEFELIVTDLKMDKMDGIHLLEAARQVSPNTDIVMVTGYATVSTAVDALKKGAAHYLPKPINLEELRAAVRQIRENKRRMQPGKSPVFCFSGPPGTGKTSIGKAIASAIGRKFTRISLAGLRDEAELRGHRRTYVGSMPGRLLTEIRRLGARNPVFMLDEMDKIGQDFRGDPASILLEMLDPEQNCQFVDHYLDIGFDLSDVMFIATANLVDGLPGPLMDRLEVIEFPGYTEKEKKVIARNYIVPRQMREHGLTHSGLEFDESALLAIIRDYTLESGLRNLDREIATVCRKLARVCLQAGDGRAPERVDEALVTSLLGPKKFRHETAAEGQRVGVTTGLVWTEFGGEIISVEAAIMEGSRQLMLTGSLGAVIRESAQTALSYVRSNPGRFGIDPDFFRGKDIHIHIPAGAIPKDGPSAGVTIAMALISLLTGSPARRDVALSGELTLSGGILPVNGVREKVLAAQRAGVKTVIFPEGNRTDIAALEPDVTEGVNVELAADIPSIAAIVLAPLPINSLAERAISTINS